MTSPILYIDRSRIRPGKRQELERAIDDLVAFIDEREPQLLTYDFYLDDETDTMTVVALHPDAASVELHMDVGGEAFRGFAEFIEMDAIEVYGEPSDRMLRQLAEKAAALGDRSRVKVVRSHAGFSRLGAPVATHREA